MRIIGGTAKRTKLDSLDCEGLRPMLDRVRESLFNILQADVQGTRVLDLFSGTGALGIEALSRGAVTAVFIDNDRRLTELIRQNLEKCDMSDRGAVLTMDAMKLTTSTPPIDLTPAELVFVDPPYALIEDPNERRRLFSALEAGMCSWYGRNAVLMVHHLPKPHMLWSCRNLECFDVRVYGRSQLSFFRPAEKGQE